MKKTKLLMPILTIGAMTSVIAPIATSCGQQSKHIKTTEFTTKELNSNNVATYLFVLDNENYQEGGFVVNTTVVPSNADVTDDDFTTSFELDGKMLRVHVKYIGTKTFDAVETIKLNINVKYFNNWEQTLDVGLKVGSEESTEIKMTYGEHYCSEVQYTEFYTNYACTSGKDYTFVINMSDITDGKQPNVFKWFEGLWDDSTGFSYSFDSAIVLVDNVLKTEGDDFVYRNDEDEKKVGIEFDDTLISTFTTSTVIKIILKNIKTNTLEGIPNFTFYGNYQ